MTGDFLLRSIAEHILRKESTRPFSIAADGI